MKILLLILTMSFLGSAAQATENSAYIPQIGFVLPLSGEWAFLGEGIRDGALLAQQDLANKGESIRLVFEDNQGDLAKSLSVGRDLIEVRRVDAIVSIISGVGNVIVFFLMTRTPKATPLPTPTPTPIPPTIITP